MKEKKKPKAKKYPKDYLDFTALPSYELLQEPHESQDDTYED